MYYVITAAIKEVVQTLSVSYGNIYHLFVWIGIFVHALMYDIYDFNFLKCYEYMTYISLLLS